MTVCILSVLVSIVAQTKDIDVEIPCANVDAYNSFKRIHDINATCGHTYYGPNETHPHLENGTLFYIHEKYTGFSWKTFVDNFEGLWFYFASVWQRLVSIR